ncbi:hypothetical protein [Kutzneria buriramensis]|uniref:Uncharacterized protein n=1 Tax=Kutzneria buriramensis TaxID=1045776 RepID=A0A3E0GWP0_9PSEU|nr:hypothetical protein [Kutzneria buriramensis]REH31131.1 hypothetical protein BCF44_122154 [Kutzneria buriramensis]
MSDQSVLPAGGDARSRSELIAAVPTIRQLIKQLDAAIKPAVVAECEAPEAQAICQAIAAIKWMADAVDAPDRAARIERLTEVGNRADYVTRAAQQRLAELQSMAELAADELHRRVIGLDTTAIIDRAQLDVGLPGGATATITVAVAADGRVAWEAPTMDLDAVDGSTQLAVTTALTQLGETLTKVLPDSAFTEQ